MAYRFGLMLLLGLCLSELLLDLGSLGSNSYYGMSYLCSLPRTIWRALRTRLRRARGASPTCGE